MQWIFSYGTLIQDDVQLATFGRRLLGHPDELRGFERTAVTIRDPNVIRETGLMQYENIVPTANGDGVIRGVALEVTADELSLADRYEAGAAYRRISVQLASGRQAWVYRRLSRPAPG